MDCIEYWRLEDLVIYQKPKLGECLKISQLVHTILMLLCEYAGQIRYAYVQVEAR